MARVGVVHVLKHWLESSKTYHGPINLRFTWPIELTRTHLLLTDYDERWIISLLGNRHHGFHRRSLINEHQYESPITIEIYHRGRKILKYGRKDDGDMHVRHSFRITEAHIAVPAILYVHLFKMSWHNDSEIRKLKLVRTKSVTIDMYVCRPNPNMYWAVVFTCGRYSSYKGIPINTPYFSLLNLAAKLAE